MPKIREILRLHYEATELYTDPPGAEAVQGGDQQVCQPEQFVMSNAIPCGRTWRRRRRTIAGQVPRAHCGPREDQLLS